jgi:hypothetical protein
MSYSEIDPVLSLWASNNNLVFSIEHGETGRRVIHTSSELGETFQIVIEDEKDLFVRIDGHLIEGRNEEEVHYVWEFPITELQSMLDAIKRTIEVWFCR